MAGWASTSVRRPSLNSAGKLSKARTIVWNGPLGMFEKPAFAQGTLAMARAVAAATVAGATSIVGGGDSVAAVEQSGVAAPDFPHLDRRRRFSRISRRRKTCPASKRSAKGRVHLRRPVIAGNWKMYKTQAETCAFFDVFLPARRGIKALRHRRGAAIYGAGRRSTGSSRNLASRSPRRTSTASRKAHSLAKSVRGCWSRSGARL